MTRKKPTTKKPAARKTPSGAKPRRRASPRDAINVAAIIDALEQHVMGDKKMTATQVSAALALLKKTLPDMAEPRKTTDAAAPPCGHEDALRELE